MKVTNPDGGIHSIGKKQFEGTGNERDDKVVEWPKEGWTLSLDKAPEFQHCFIFSYLSGGRNSALVKLALMDIVNMLGPYYIPYLTSLKAALGRFVQTLLAQKGLSSGINQPNEPQTFQFVSKIY